MAFPTVRAPYCSADRSSLSFFLSSTAFTTVCMRYYSADGSALLILPLINGFHNGLRAVLHSRWRGGLLILSLVNGFHDGLCTVLCSRWQRIAHTSARQWLSRQFAHRIALRMATDCSFFLLSTAFTTVCTLYWSADGSALLILLLVNGFSDGSHAVLQSGWQRIDHSSARQWLSRRFVRSIAQQLEAPCSFLHSLTSFPTVRAPYCSVDGSSLLILPLVNGFKDGLRAILRCGWQRIEHTSAR